MNQLVGAHWVSFGSSRSGCTSRTFISRQARVTLRDYHRKEHMHQLVPSTYEVLQVLRVLQCGLSHLSFQSVLSRLRCPTDVQICVTVTSEKHTNVRIPSFHLLQQVRLFHCDRHSHLYQAFPTIKTHETHSLTKLLVSAPSQSNGNDFLIQTSCTTHVLKR